MVRLTPPIKLLYIPVGLFAAISILINIQCVQAKVHDFGSKLPEFIKNHPDRSWLIKFYAPWCYHCQQLEPTYVNVADKLDHRLDKLIVGRVDCTKHGSACQHYQVQSYPTVTFIRPDYQVKYRGDRTVESMVDFAERLYGPDINPVNDCNHLQDVVNKHGIVLLSTQRNTSSEYHEEFKNIIGNLKASYWFYHFTGTCKDLDVIPDGLYILKKHMSRSIKLVTELGDDVDLNSEITKWIERESYPVFSQISGYNLDHSLKSGKMIAMAVLDEYKPAKKFTDKSRAFYKEFENFAKTKANSDVQVRLAWTSDLEMIQSIILGHITTPNFILLKPDLTYNLLFKNSNNEESNDKEVTIDQSITPKIIDLIDKAKSGKLIFEGGDSYFYALLRFFYGHYCKFTHMYKSNPLLASILIGLPSIIIIFVIYTSCCYDGVSNSDESDEESDDERADLISRHHKQE